MQPRLGTEQSVTEFRFNLFCLEKNYATIEMQKIFSN
jgi:hypothetical protein